MYTTRATVRVDATPERVYAAVTDPAVLPHWRFPDGMTATVDASDGEGYRMSLRYSDAEETGKSRDNVDAYTSRFVERVPHRRVVEEIVFDTPDPTLRSPMRVSVTPSAADDGATLVEWVHEGVPDAVPAADNEAGTRMALDRLAALFAR